MQMKNAERDYTVAYICFDVEDPALQDPFSKYALNKNDKKLKKDVDKK